MTDEEPKALIAAWSERHSERRQAAAIRAAKRWVAFLTDLNDVELIGLAAAVQRETERRSREDPRFDV